MHTTSPRTLLAALLFLALLSLSAAPVGARTEEGQPALDALESALDSMEKPATKSRQTAPSSGDRAVRQPADPALSGKKNCYTNQKFHYGLCYPAGSLIGQGESDSGDGQRFVSPDKKIVLLAWGYANYNNESVRQNYASMENSVDFRVTYKRQSGDWFVLSGLDQDGIVYLKRWVGQDYIVTLQMHYPKSQKGRVDPLLRNILDSVSRW